MRRSRVTRFVVAGLAIAAIAASASLAVPATSHARSMSCSATALQPIENSGNMTARGQDICSVSYSTYVCLQVYTVGWNDESCGPTLHLSSSYDPTHTDICQVFGSYRTRLWTSYSGSVYSSTKVC